MARDADGLGGRGERMGVGRAAHRRSPRDGDPAHGHAPVQARAQPRARVQVHVPLREGFRRPWRGEPFRRAVHGALGHDRHGQHRGRGDGHRRGRPRRALLDGGGGVLRHGHEVRGGASRGEVPRGAARRSYPRRSVLLHRARPRAEVEVACGDVRVLRRDGGYHGHRHDHADQRHHVRRAALLRPGLQPGRPLDGHLRVRNHVLPRR